jgi:hypothetical protein
MIHDIANALVPFFLNGNEIYCRRSETREIADRFHQCRARGLRTFIRFAPRYGKHETRKLADLYHYNSMPVPSFVFVSLAHLNSAFEVEKRLAAVRAVALGMPNFAAVGYRCFTPYMANTKPALLAQTPSLPEQNANAGGSHACCPLVPSRRRI